MTSMVVMATAFVLAEGAPASARVVEVASREAVDLLSGVSLVYDSLLEAPFNLRAFTFRRDGECVEGEPCDLHELLVSVSTLDEYPDRRAFRARHPGVFRRLAIVRGPKDERGEFRLALYTLAEPGGEACRLYAVTLRAMRELPEACPPAREGR